MNLKSIITTAAFAFLASLASGSAKAQNCQFIGVYEIYDNCYLARDDLWLVHDWQWL